MRQSSHDFDVVVVGAGLVGAALARALRGMSLALLARERPEHASNGTEFDARVYAISPGNAAFLARIGAWQRVPPERLTAVHAMRVHGDDGASLLEFDAYRAGAEALAWIVEDGLLQQALWHGLEDREDLRVFAPTGCERLEFSRDRAELVLRGGATLAARLVVGADGARSLVRAQAGIAFEESGYGQTAVVANFACERAHRNVAWQWFQGGPVLALLPLPGEHVSMVWSLPDAEARRLLALDAATLGREVAAASHHALGSLAPVTPARGFALRRLAARRLVAPRLALLGDAAHVVHPLAGQGANLGFQDAQALAAVLAARDVFRDPGDARLLRRYERARAEDILAIDVTVDGLFRLFNAKGEFIARLRNAGLNLTDRLPVVKNVLMRHAMGAGATEIR